LSAFGTISLPIASGPKLLPTNPAYFIDDFVRHSLPKFAPFLLQPGFPKGFIADYGFIEVAAELIVL
jgi:hypothetical protein